MGGVMTMLSGLGSVAAPLGLALTAGSQIMSGYAAQQESKVTAETYRANAAIAAKQAENQAAQEKEKYRRFAASQRAAYGASGVDVNMGSPIDVLADTDAEGSVSVMQLLYGGQLEEANWRTRANTTLASGKNSMAGGILGGLNSTLRYASRSTGGF